MFVYKALHPERQLLDRGRVIAGRLRAGLRFLILVLGVIVGYQLPIEVASGFQRLNEHQARQLSERAERRMLAEQRHARQMITIFGSPEAYLAFLNSQTASKHPL